MKPVVFGRGPNGKPAIEWHRPGVAAKGEPSTFTEVREYESEEARLAAFFDESRDAPALSAVSDADLLGALKIACRHDPSTGYVVNPMAAYHLAAEHADRRCRKAQKPAHGVLALEVLGLKLPVEVMKSQAGFYLGTYTEEGPCSRESGRYWATREAAQAALDSGDWSYDDHNMHLPLRRHGACAFEATGRYLELQVINHEQLAQYFIGTSDGQRPISRESMEVFDTPEAAREALSIGAWTQLEVESADAQFDRPRRP